MYASVYPKSCRIILDRKEAKKRGSFSWPIELEFREEPAAGTFAAYMTAAAARQLHRKLGAVLRQLPRARR